MSLHSKCVGGDAQASKPLRDGEIIEKDPLRSGVAVHMDNPTLIEAREWQV